MYDAPVSTPSWRPIRTLALVVILLLASGGIVWAQGAASPGHPAAIDSSRVRVVNMSPEMVSIIVESGPSTDTIANVGAMTASRSIPVMFGALTYRTRIGSGEWSSPASTLVRHEMILSVLFSASSSGSGIAVTLYDRASSRRQDSLSANPTPRIDQGQIRVAVLPRGTAIYQAEVVGNPQSTRKFFTILQKGIPWQEQPIVNLDPGAFLVDLHVAEGSSMLDRIRFQPIRAGERHRILLVSYSDSTFEAWRYDELDSNSQSLVSGDHLPVDLVEGQVRVVNLFFSDPIVGRITPGADTLNVGFQTSSRWVGSTGGRLILNGYWTGDERYNDTFDLARKGLTSLVLYESLADGNENGLGVLALRTFPFLDGGGNSPSLRVANGTGYHYPGIFELKREGGTVARFDTMSVGMILPYQRVEGRGTPNEYSLYSSRGGGTEWTSPLTLPLGSYTTIIVTTGPALAGAKQGERSERPGAFGLDWVWALREFPDDATTSALTLLSSPSSVREEYPAVRASIWPNPSRGTLSIRLEPGAPLVGTLVATDMLGRIVADFGEQHLAAGVSTIEVDLSGLGSGVYTLSIVEKGGRRIFVGEVVRR